MSYHFAWDEFSVLLYLWDCKNRQSSERLIMRRSTFEISDRGGVCRFYIRIMICNSFFWWTDTALYTLYLLPTTAPWAFCYFHWSMEVVLHVQVLDHHHCAVSVHKIFCWISEYIQSIVGWLFLSSWSLSDFVQLALSSVNSSEGCKMV
jgi:hypothetical protein